MAVPLGILLGIVAMVCWGTADFFVAKAVRKTSVLKTFLWSQMIGIFIFFAIFSLFFRLPILSLSAISIILVAGFLGVISYLAFYKGLQVGKISIVSPVTACWGAVTFMLSLVFLNESVTAVQASGVYLAILGAVLVSFRWNDLLGARMGNIIKGAEYGIVAALAWGVYYIFFDVAVMELNWFVPMLLFKGMSVLYLLAYFGAAKKDFAFPRNAWAFVLPIGILETTGFMAYGLGITSEHTAIVAPIGAAFPAVTIILAGIFLKETLETNQKIGVVSVLTGLILLSL